MTDQKDNEYDHNPDGFEIYDYNLDGYDMYAVSDTGKLDDIYVMYCNPDDYEDGENCSYEDSKRYKFVSKVYKYDTTSVLKKRIKRDGWQYVKGIDIDEAVEAIELAIRLKGRE